MLIHHLPPFVFKIESIQLATLLMITRDIIPSGQRASSSEYSDEIGYKLFERLPENSEHACNAMQIVISIASL